MKTGCYWGRFNPPHRGHMRLIRKLLRHVDKLVIVIGSAQYRNTKRNPFSGRERAAMLKAYLKESGIAAGRVKVIPLPDLATYASSMRNVVKAAGQVDFLFTDKSAVIQAAQGKVQVKKIRRAGTISSTKIRDAIACGGKWEHLTGKTVALLVKKFGGIRRIKKAYGR